MKLRPFYFPPVISPTTTAQLLNRQMIKTPIYESTISTFSPPGPPSGGHFPLQAHLSAFVVNVGAPSTGSTGEQCHQLRRVFGQAAAHLV